MAGATPVLEREVTTQEKDRQHNAQISENYARLLNPDFKLSEFKNNYAPVQDPVQVNNIAPSQEVTFVQNPVQEVVAQCAPVQEQSAASENTYSQEQYRVDDARPDSPLWFAYSEMNQKRMQTQSEVSIEKNAVEEEENEDLRPTLTTIQYQTENAKRTVEEGATISTHNEKRLSFSKRDKIVIAAVVTMIVALFVLIVINSAIISGINSDINKLQSSLNSVRGAYSGVSAQISEYTENLEETLKALAKSLGMVK